MNDDEADQPPPTVLLMINSWQATLILGLVTIVLGVIVTAHPNGSLRVLAVLIGIALIVSGANVSAFAGPYVTGYVEDLTGNFRDTLLLITVIMLLGALTIAFTGRSALRSPTESGTAPSQVRPAGDLASARPARH